MSKITNPEALARITQISEADRLTFEARMARAFEAVEFPEADPAERDPEEAEPTPGRYFTKVKVGGLWMAPQYWVTLAESLDAIHSTELPAIIGLGIFTIHVNVAAYNSGVRAVAVCPIHGAECEVWA